MCLAAKIKPPRLSPLRLTMNLDRKFTLYSILTFCVAFGPAARAADPAVGAPVDLSALGDSGLYSQTLDRVTPVGGCLEAYDLVLPQFNAGVLNRAPVGTWVAGYLTQPSYFISFNQFQNLGYNKIRDPRFRHAFDHGYYLLLKLPDGRYLAVLPLVSAGCRSSSHGPYCCAYCQILSTIPRP